MTRFGKFEVGEVLGQGGFGRVFKGYDPILKREVAIKTCTLTDPAMRKRFLREAEIAAGLRHPNIVVIHDLGEHEGEPYIVQEYLPGEDLDAVIHRKDALPLEIKLRFLAQIADALGYAHSKGIIHRDIKPKNIRVLTSGDIRVLDFGIAKRSFDDTGTALTQTGVGMGTVGYISPEQLKGDKVDHRTDIFSFGALAFEALSGVKPFDAETLHSVFYKIMHEDPHWPDSMPGHVPAPLRSLVERCMAKNPDDRPNTGGEIARILNGFAASATAGATLDDHSAGQDEGTRVWTPTTDTAPPAGNTSSPVTAAPVKPSANRKIAFAAAAVTVLAAFGWYANSVARSGSGEVVTPDTVASSHSQAAAPSNVQPADTLSNANPTPQQPQPQPQPREANSPVAAPASTQLLPGSVLLALNLEDSGNAPNAAARVAAQTLARALENAGYRVTVSSSRIGSAQASRQAAARGGSALAAYGQLTISDIVEKNEFGMASAFAMIDVQAFDAATGREIGRASQQIAGAGTTGSMAAANAAQRVAEKAGAELVSALPPRSN